MYCYTVGVEAAIVDMIVIVDAAVVAIDFDVGIIVVIVAVVVTAAAAAAIVTDKRHMAIIVADADAVDAVDGVGMVFVSLSFIAV